MKTIITYDGNDNESYTLMQNGKAIGSIHLGEDAVIEITKHINQDINLHSGATELKFDFSPEGIILDVFESGEKDTYTYWFNDYKA